MSFSRDRAWTPGGSNGAGQSRAAARRASHCRLRVPAAAAANSEFLSAIKHRAPSGGTCEFDLPDYYFWLSQEDETRVSDLQRVARLLRPCATHWPELLWLTASRPLAQPEVVIRQVELAGAPGMGVRCLMALRNSESRSGCRNAEPAV